MIALLLVLLPLLAAILIFMEGSGNRGFYRIVFIATAVFHALLTFSLLLLPGHPLFTFAVNQSELLGFDGLSQLFLSITSLLFLLTALHMNFWLPRECEAARRRSARLKLPEVVFLPEHVFLAGLLAFLAMMTLVCASRNLGIMWVALEATTLVTAPLINFRRSSGSVEAMWKYLLICSVGIGLALFGTMLLAVACHAPELKDAGLNLNRLLAHHELLEPGWFKAAFIFALAGYGAKMGLAPFHTWLPDAHSEAPATVSALLSGALLNCSFLALLRFYELAPEALKPFCADLLVVMGVFSLGLAAFFIIHQNDYKRMLAYSSVEHMGLIAILWGIGSEGAAMLHLSGHSLLKMALFLVAGNILLAYGTRKVSVIGGAFRQLPRNAILWICGILLICGTPPSPLFISEFILVRDASPGLAAVVLVLLFVVCAGMSRIALQMTMGTPRKVEPDTFAGRHAERLLPIPIMAMLGCGGLGMFLWWMLTRGLI